MDWLSFLDFIATGVPIAAWFLSKRFHLSERVETRIRRRTRSEKVRVGLRTLVYTIVAGVCVFLVALEEIIRSAELATPLPVIIGLILFFSFVGATVKTSGEDLPTSGAPDAAGEPAS